MSADRQIDRDAVVRMYREGAKTSAITAETGASRSSIYEILQEAGIAPARRGARTPSPIDQDLRAPMPVPSNVSDVDGVLAWALQRVAELEREVGRLTAMLQMERERSL
jgi:transposase